MNVIDLFNTAVSAKINKHDLLYETWFGKIDFTPEVIIIDSEDFNCGAICNEFEYARLVSQYFIDSFDIDKAEGGELTDLILRFIDLPRRGSFESDESYRSRFKFIVVQNSNEARTTKWAILDALKYYIPNVSENVQIVENFDSSNLYFQIRIEGEIISEGILFLNSETQGFTNYNFVGGIGYGSIVTYLEDLIKRIRAAGVEVDMIFMAQFRFTKTSNAFIGTVQMYKQSDATIMKVTSFTKTANAVIV